MAKELRTAHDLSSWDAAMKAQQTASDENRLSAIHAEWEKYGEIKDRELLLRIGYSSETFVKRLLGTHPAKSLHDALKMSNVLLTFWSARAPP